MRFFSYMVVVFTALALMGCGARQKREAAAPETDPWKDYKGTFASGVPTKEELKKADDAENPKKAEAKKNDKAEKTSSDSKSFVASNKKTPESKAAESKPAEVKPVPVTNDARSMYNETGDNAAAADAISEESAPAPKKGGKKTGKKGGGGGGKKAGGKKGAAKK